MVHNLYQISVGTEPQQVVNNLVGMCWYMRNGDVTVMVMRNVMYITSTISDSDIEVDMDLPAHPAFYLHCVSTDGEQNILIDRDARLSVTLQANFQIQAVCPL